MNSTSINKINAPRNKSSEKVNVLYNPKQNYNPIYNLQNNIFYKQNNLMNNFQNYKKIRQNVKSNQIHMEGDLNFSNNNPNYNNGSFNKNVGNNPFEIMIQKHSIPNKNIIKINNPNINHRHIPRKSPLPIPRSFLINNPKYIPIKKVNINYYHNESNNSLNPMNKTYNKYKLLNNHNNIPNNNIHYNHKSNLIRSLSPITRPQNKNIPKYPSNEKPKYISKSPILQSTLLKNINKYHIISNNNNNNLNNSTKLNINVPLNRPYTSYNSHRLSNTNINIRNEKINNIQKEKEERNYSSNSQRIKYNIIKVNMSNNKSPPNPQNINNIKTSNNNIINNYKVISNNNIILNPNNPHLSNFINQSNSASNIFKPNSNNLYIKSPLIPLNKLNKKKIRNIYQFTHVGFDGEQDKEHNQDISFIETNFAGEKDFLFLSVCDGHGVEGHEVSSFIKRTLPKEMTNNLNNKDILSSDQKIKREINEIIKETFIKTNEKLIENLEINSTFSGSTCISIIYTPYKIISANIGDSRAVMGKYNKEKNEWISCDLSRDHKPTEKDEAKRIYENNGRIQPFIDEDTGEFIGPQRVWVKEDDVPGLAMTRSFGDRVAASVGTICIPEIMEFLLTDDDKFIILASDGVWEFIHSQECINIVKDFYLNNDMKGCCEFLYSESKKRWMKEEEVVDDITMILIFFE